VNLARLIVLAGLPGSGKPTIARGLTKKIGAVWLRIDSIEQAIRESGVVSRSLDDAGYRAAYAVAEDNPRLGDDIVGDSVNPWMSIVAGSKPGRPKCPASSFPIRRL
jgi:predicted kinase